jgi:hypothetical protein
MPHGSDWLVQSHTEDCGSRVGCARSAVSATVTYPRSPRDEVRAKTATAGYASGWIEEFVQAQLGRSNPGESASVRHRTLRRTAVQSALP